MACLLQPSALPHVLWRCHCCCLFPPPWGARHLLSTPARSAVCSDGSKAHTRTSVTPSGAAGASRHPGPPPGAVGEPQARPSSEVLPCAPAAACSRFPGELPHRLETALLVNNWRWDVPKDLGHLRLLAAAWLYISTQHHIARPQCSLFPASILY